MKRYIFILMVLSILFTSCEKWFDINTNPNKPEVGQITSDYILSACEYDIINNHVNSSNAMMISQHMTKSGEFSGAYTFLSGQVMPQNVDDWWEFYYQVITNLNIIYNKAVESNSSIYKGISQTLICLNYQRLVDIWGNVPYAQASNPTEFQNPTYDKGEDIYAGLLVRIDEAIAELTKIQQQQADPILSKADIYCQGSPKLWLQFASTIKLRLLMRLSNVQNVGDKLTQLLNSGNLLPINANIEGNPGYYAEKDKMNRFYEIYGWNKNGGPATNFRQYMPTSHLVDLLRNNNDPRLRVYANPRTRLGNPGINEGADYDKFGLTNEYYVGIPYGQSNPPGMVFTSTTGVGVLAGGADKENGRLRSSTLISGAEVGFFLAEAALKGLIPGGDAKAKEYYQAAVIAAMNRHEKAMQDPSQAYGLKGMKDPITTSAKEAAIAYMSQDNSIVNWDKMLTQEKKLEAICTQKWLSLYGYNPLESWFEQRRNDLPKLKASHQAQSPKLISKLPYPQTERNLNSEEVEKQGDVDVYESLVFWDLVNPRVEMTELYE